MSFQQKQMQGKKFLKKIYKSSRTSSSYRKDENISELMNAEQK